MKQQKNGMRWAFIIFMVVLILALTYCTRFMLVQIEDMEERELLDSTSISKEELENTIQKKLYYRKKKYLFQQKECCK